METILSTEAQRIDKQALVRIYEEYSPGLYRYAYRLLGDQDLAEECVSETFSRFLQVIRRGSSPEGNLRAYLYRMVHNWVVDHYRKQAPQVSLETGTYPDPDSSLEKGVDSRQEMDQFRMALLNLPEEQRMVIELRFMEDWSHAQVANFLGKTVDATRALQHRALVALRQTMPGLEEI
ncbi:MAG: RNA polymerase sigma factor [Anaerolineaceae bacterium]|nr:RNA polymerase sigma factor [Anaerolineaceae bacterium]